MKPRTPEVAIQIGSVGTHHMVNRTAILSERDSGLMFGDAFRLSAAVSRVQFAACAAAALAAARPASYGDMWAGAAAATNGVTS